MADTERLYVARDLPAPATDVGEQLKRLGPEWYLPTNPYVQLEELLTIGEVHVVRRGPGIYECWLEPSETPTIRASGERVTDCLREIYNKARTAGLAA